MTSGLQATIGSATDRHATVGEGAESTEVDRSGGSNDFTVRKYTVELLLRVLNCVGR